MVLKTIKTRSPAEKKAEEKKTQIGIWNIIKKRETSAAKGPKNADQAGDETQDAGNAGIFLFFVAHTTEEN